MTFKFIVKFVKIKMADKFCPLLTGDSKKAEPNDTDYHASCVMILKMDVLL